MPSIKKKKKTLLFPCTVFHSDKTSRLHAAQHTAPEKIQKAQYPELLFIYLVYIHKSATASLIIHGPHTHLGKLARGPPAASSQRAATAVPPESPSPYKPTEQASQPSPKDPQVTGGKERKENHGSSDGSLEQEGDQINKYIYITLTAG